MTYPFDQFAALAKANGQLVSSLAEVARTGAADYAQLSGKAATAFLDQLKELKPGVVPSFKSEGVTTLLTEAEKSRAASLSKIGSAFNEWQGCCKDVLTQTANQQELTDTVQAWFQPLLKGSESEPEKAKTPVREPAKTAQAA